MITLPLEFRNGHLFAELAGQRWLLDTGAPNSFGAARSLSFAGEEFILGTSHFGLTAATLSQHVCVMCAGLVGMDILGGFDHIFDTTNGTLTVSAGELPHRGERIPMDEFMGIPIVTASVGGSDYRMILDTGAQISYFQHDSLMNFPAAGRVQDFYPGAGQFEIDTYDIPISLGRTAFTLRCGALPAGLLATTLKCAGAKGIIGNAILNDRAVGYFPRRRVLVL